METIHQTITRKERELEGIFNNAEFQSSIGLDKMADNEILKAKRLMKEINKLKTRI